MLFLFDLFISGAAAMSLTALILRLNHLSWQTHDALVVGVHVGMAIQCSLTLFRVIVQGGGVSISESVSAVTVFFWVIYSMAEWEDYRPPERFKKDGTA